MTEEKTITTNSHYVWGFVTCDARTHSDGKRYFSSWAHDGEVTPKSVLNDLDEAHKRLAEELDGNLD